MPSHYDPDLYEQALFFAAEAHRGHRFPGRELPYLVHLVHVAGELSAALAREDGLDADLAVQCALLHDCVEDAGVSPEALAERFGAPVSAGVLALSKDERLPKEERMADSLRRLLLQPREVRMVKLADRIANLAEPPHYWSQPKRAAYRAEGQLILDTLGHASPILAARLTHRIERYARFLT